MKYQEKLKYSDMEFVRVQSHYDIHLRGLCRYGKRMTLHSFETNEETETCTIYHLGFFKKLKWLCKKKLFELCVGYHWTYPYCTYGYCFNPDTRLKKWFCKVYYKYKFNKLIKI